MLSPDCISKVEMAQNWALKLAAIYAEIAKGMDDPSLQVIFYSLTGDMYGHSRTLAVFYELNGSTEQHAASQPTKSFPSSGTGRLKPLKGGENNGKILSSMQQFQARYRSIYPGRNL